jgi:hypothetical protein
VLDTVFLRLRSLCWAPKETAFFRPAEAFSYREGGKIMTQDEEKILKVTKEIVVKFIEVGRVSPTQFDGFFQSVFQAVKSTVSSDEETKSS